MNDPSKWDAVAIDTNVFEHLFNPEQNRLGHINKTLDHLQKNNTKLLVDSKSKILKEYFGHLDQLLRKPERRNETSSLRYWMTPEIQKQIDVDERDDLMNAIKSVVHEHNADVDRALIYVAFFQGDNLISNDENHIVVGPKREQGHEERRYRLKRNTRRTHRPSRQSKIMTSLEAHADVMTNLRHPSEYEALTTS